MTIQQYGIEVEKGPNKYTKHTAISIVLDAFLWAIPLHRLRAKGLQGLPKALRLWRPAEGPRALEGWGGRGDAKKQSP